MKNLSERVSARNGQAGRSSPRNNRAVVLSLRADIRGALDDGWSVLAIFETLRDEGAVTFSYQTFRLHVNRLLLGKSVGSATASTAAKASKGGAR